MCTRLRIFFFAILLYNSSTAYSRFYHLDADEVDREDLLKTAYYNDLYSYQYPLSWDSSFQDAQFAYRGWGGSLDINRSYVEEDIKLLSSKEPRPVELQFRQRREEGLLEPKFLQEIRFQLNSPWGFYVAPMVDAGTYKKWDDFGAAAHRR